MSSVFSRFPRRSRVALFFASVLHIRTSFTLVIAVVAVLANAMSARIATVSSRESKAEITVRAAGRLGAYLNLQDGRSSKVSYRGDDPLVLAMRSGSALSRTLAFADLDGDAAPDLISGYAYGSVGILSVQFGNTEGFAPKDDSIFVRMQQGYVPDSLLPTVNLHQVPVAAEFLQVGDFNKDGFEDVLLAARGRDLYLLDGDGHGQLSEPERIGLPGVVTALDVGEFRAADGQTDVAVGITGADGPQVLVFDGAAGGLKGAAPFQFRLSSNAVAVEFGELDRDPFMDLAVAAGSEITAIHGWGRKTSAKLETRVEHIPLTSSVQSIAVDNFVWDRGGAREIAVLSDDGSVRILEQSGLDKRQFSEAELLTRAALRGRATNKNVDVEKVEAWSGNSKAQWSSVGDLALDAATRVGGATQGLLMHGKIAAGETNPLLVLNTGQNRLELVRETGGNEVTSSSSVTAGDISSSSLDVTSAPVAVVALPRKVNGYQDLVVLSSSSTTPTIVPSAPTATLNVTRFDDPAPGACAVGDCSLREAVIAANTGAGADTIMLPAGTYTLTIIGNTNNMGAGEGFSGNPAIGDLDFRDTGATPMNSAPATGDLTTVMGAGAASTFIVQSTANDRVIEPNPIGNVNFDWSISAVTVAGGRDTGGSTTGGGGGWLSGSKDNTTTVTNCVLANNRATGLGGSGGGGFSNQGGSVTVTNTVFGGSVTVAGCPSQTATNCGNSTVASGGGLGYSSGDPFGRTPSAGTLTIQTNSSFQNNTADSLSAGGAGADLYTSNLGTGSASITNATFTSNLATGTASGGGIIVESLDTTVATTTFTNNSAGNRGGGIYVGGASLTLNGTGPSINFTGNTAGVAGSSISAASSVTLQGTNTTIGGDLEITTNGLWTNAVGSTMSPNNLIIIGTGSFTANNSTTNVGGNFQFQSGTFNAGTGLFNFNGTSAQTINNSVSITFNNLTNSNTSSTLTVNNNIVVNGTLNINANTILAPLAATVISGPGTLTGSGTVRVTRTAATAGFLNQYTITNKTVTNLTVHYLAASAQSISPFTYGHLRLENAAGATLGGNVTVNGLLTLTSGAMGVGTSTLNIMNGTSVGTGSITSSATGTVNYGQTSDGQDVRAFNYGNLTFSNFNKVLAGTGTIFVQNIFTPGTATGHTIAGSTINFNGTGAQTIPAFNYFNLSTSIARSSGTNITLVNGGTIGIAGAFTPLATFSGGGAYVITNNTVNYNGSTGQTIAAFNYNNLTSSNIGARTLQNGGTIGIAGVFTTGSNTYTVTNSTVNFNGTALQTIPIFTFNNLTLTNVAGANLAGNVTVGGALLLASGPLGVGTNTLTLNGAASFGAGSLTSAATGTVIYNQGTNGQATVLAANYGNLTFSNFNKTLASTGTIGIAGVFTPGTATGHTITGSTINFNGAGAQTIPGFTYNNLTSTGAVSRVLDPVNTIKIAGVFTPGASMYTITNSTVEYNGTSAQTMPNTFLTYNNLTANNAAGVTGFAGLTVQGLLTVASGTFTSSSNYNNVQINSGATMVGVGGSTINVSGNWTNNGGTFTPNNSTVVFNGNGNAQTIGGTAASQTFGHVTVNKTSNSVSIGGSTTTLNIIGNLTLQSGVLNAGTATAINATGNWTNNIGPTAFVPGVSVVSFNNTIVPQTINGTAVTQAFNHFTVVKITETLSVGGSTTTLDIGGNLTINTGTFNGPATINLIGNWTNGGGTFGGGSGVVNFNGAGAQTISGAVPTTFNNLTVNNATGLAMNNNNTVNGILALTSGDITVAPTFLLTQPNTGSSSGTFDVIGSLKRTGFVSGGGALSFGNPFNTIQITSGTAPTEITVNLAKTTPPNPIGFPNAVQRTYTITGAGGAGYAATLRLHYLDSELNGNLEGSLNLWRFITPLWRFQTITGFNSTDNWIEKIGISELFFPWTMNSTNAPTATNGTISGRITNADGSPVVGAVIRLTGTQNRKTITDANGHYNFSGVETSGFYTVVPSRANYSFSPAERSFNQLGERTEASFSGASGGDSQNPLDTAEYFIRQQYVDLLNREPDEGGFNYWSDRILECGNDARCVSARRRDIAAAFFIEQEFQQTGSFIYGFYKGSLGRVPAYSEYSADRAGLVVGPQLDAMKQAYSEDFVGRSEFVAKYAANSTAESFVDALLANVRQASGIDLSSQRAALITRYNAGSSLNQSRSFAVRELIEGASFRQTEYNSAFVLTEYFGYLRRDPDQGGYAFWLNVLNNREPGNFRGMVCAFITSTEYQQRFSAIVSRSDQECGQ